MAKGKVNGPDPVDVVVGQNVRKLRTLRGLSQSNLAEALEMTFQQIQKYEKGTNRIASSNLVRIATTLGVNISTLFDGIDTQASMDADPEGKSMLAISQKGFQVGRLWDKADEPVKKAVLALLQAVTDKNSESAIEVVEHEVPRRRKSA
jgi:transcriptional regulator with XRE-family HTH domain